MVNGKYKIALLTTFINFIPGYSLTGIVKDQAKMLAKKGHEVHLFVNERYKGETFSEDVILEKKIPFTHLKDYRSRTEISDEHKDTANKTEAMLLEELQKDYDFVYTHDFVFIGWNYPYARGILQLAQNHPNEIGKIRWLHWIHSIPSINSDWWCIKEFGPSHKLIYPNEADRLRVAEQYRGEINDVRVIPHIKDLRTWGDFDEETCELLDQHPEIINSDIVQVYPASVDRLSAKRVREVLLIFANLKRMGRSVCLVIANQWATGRQQREEINKYKEIATRNGLKVGREVVFTSDFKVDPKTSRGKYDVGIPKRMVRELFQCSNLFIFPTREESFGLVLPEACLSGTVLPVLNKSLDMMPEISGWNALYFDFGSFQRTHNVENEGQYYRDIAYIILGRLAQSEAIRCFTFMRQRYNMDSLYQNFYAPIMAESRTWV